MTQNEAVGARPAPHLSAAIAVLIPLGWFAAMAVSRRTNASVTMAVAVVVLLIAVLIARAIDLQTLKPTPRAVAAGLIAAVIMIAGTYAGFVVIARVFPALASQTSELYQHLDAIALVLAVVVGEEILWRGAFQRVVAERFRGPIATVLIASAVYAASLASFGSPLLVAVGFVCGLYWSALRAWSGSVIAPLIAHVAWDLVLALFPLRA